MKFSLCLFAMKFCAFFHLAHHAFGQKVAALTALRKNLFDHYVPALPLCGAPVPIHFEWTLYALIKIDDVREVLEVSSWYSMWWNDCTLRWNLTDYNVTIAEFPNTLRTWTPQLTWMQRIPSIEAFEFEDGLMSGARTMVDYTGQVSVSREITMRSYCVLSIVYFPFDTQRCNVSFTSWQMPTTQMIFWNTSARSSLDNFIASETWNVNYIKIIPKNSSAVANGVKVQYSQLVFMVVLSRKPMFYLFYLMLPFFVISILNCFVFLIPTQEQEKITFSLSILLSLCVYMMMVTEITPPKGEIPLISVYFFMVLVFAILSSSLAVLIEIVYANHTLLDPPRWLLQVAVGGIGKLSFFRLVDSPKRREVTKEEINAAKFRDFGPIVSDFTPTAADDNEKNYHVSEWHQIAYAFDRLLFLIYITVSIVIFVALISYGIRAQAINSS